MYTQLAVLCALFAVGFCNSNHTVTDEVWFDVEIKDMDGPGEDFRGRFEIALFGLTAPMTVFNFKSIAKGTKSKGRKLTYKNTPVHRIVPDFIIQMGDITTGDGTGGTSVYADKFNDEDFILSHRSPGWVAMANHGTDTNGSQFYVLLQKSRWLDGKHVVFGKVIRGMSVIRAMGEVPTNDKTAQPKLKIRIVDCGVNKLESSYVMKDAELDSTEDL